MERPFDGFKSREGWFTAVDGGLFGEIALSSNIGESAAKAESGSGSNSSDDKLKVPKNAGDDYPSKWRDAAPDTVPDDWRYWNRECVSFVASRLSRDGKKGFTGLGNAIEWANKSGLGLQKSPKVGDVAWFNELDAPGALGHVGNPDYRVGKVLTRYDNGQTLNSTSDPIQIDYYIESVSHQWNINSGYTTTLGVTRGLVSSIDRFKHWNSWKDPLTASNQGKGGLQLFDGGLFGEISLSSNIGESAAKAESGSGSNSSDDKLNVPKNAGDDYPSKWRDAAPDTVPDDWRYR